MNEWFQAEQRVERAQHLFESGNYLKAAEELRSAIAVNPYNSSWHFNLALTMDALGFYEQAVRAYRQALELDPDDPDVLNGLGVDLTRLRRYRAALDCFERIERDDPTYEPSYCNRIVTYTEMGDHDRAETMFYLARQVKEECPLCLYNIASSLYERREFRRALACLHRALELDPQQPQVHARMAEIHWSMGHLRQAREHYLAEIRHGADDMDTLGDFAELLTEQGDYDEATETYRRVLERLPDHVGAHFGLGELALRRNRLDPAEKQFRLVLRIDRRYPGAHQRLGEVMLRTGRRRQAGVHLLAELRHAGDEPQTLLELGQLLLEAGKVKQAHALLRKLVAGQPNNPHAMHSLAVSYFFLHDLEGGILHCRKALKLKPDYSLALYNLALAHMQKGQLGRARRYAAKAVAAAPADENIRALAGRLGIVGFWTNLKHRLLIGAGERPRRTRQRN